MKYYLFHPLKLEPIEQGLISKNKFKLILDNFPWVELLKEQLKASNEEINNSPSIILENEKGIGLNVSIVGELDDYEFYICYKRPTLRKKRKWFKTIEYLDENWYSIIPQQGLSDVIEAFNHLFDENYDILEKKWG